MLLGPVKFVPLKQNYALPRIPLNKDSTDFKFFCEPYKIRVISISFVDGKCEGLLCGGGAFFKSDGTFNASNCTCHQKQNNGTLFAVMTIELTNDKGKVYVVNNVVNKTIQHNFVFKETSVKVEARRLLGSPLVLMQAKNSIDTILKLAPDSKWIVSGWMKPGQVVDAVTANDNQDEYAKRLKTNQGTKVMSSAVNLHICSITPVDPSVIKKADVDDALCNIVDLAEM